MWTGSYITDTPTGAGIHFDDSDLVGGQYASTSTGSFARVQYNGSDSYWTHTRASAAYSAWFRLSGSASSVNSIFGTQQNAGVLQYSTSGNTIGSFTQYEGGTNTFSWTGTTVQDEKWHHAVVAYDHGQALNESGSVSLYLDGKKFGSSYDVHPSGSNHGNGYFAFVGRGYASGADTGWCGDLADLRIYTYPSASSGMTAEEARWLYLNPGEGGQTNADSFQNPLYNNPNIALGYQALGGDTVKNSKTYEIIDNKLDSGMQSGTSNVAIGSSAMKNITSGQQNTAVGDGAGVAITTGTTNTFLGTWAGDRTTTANGNICIGYNADPNASTDSYAIVLGTGLTGTASTRVHIGNSTSHIYNDYNSNATWTHSSDKRQKIDIKEDKLGLDFINDIKPVTFKHKSPSEFPKEWSAYDADNKEPMGGDKTIHGLIAQDVKEALDKQGIDTFGGWDEGPDGRQNVSFEAFVLPLISSVKELSSENRRLENKINDLEIFIMDKLGEQNE